MATSNLKQPPVFNPDGGDSYVDWKNDMAVWALCTKEEKKRLGPLVYLSLQGDARDAVRDVPLESLSQDDGLNKVIEKLDSIFLKDDTARAFCAIKDFVEFRRESGQSFTKFMVEFNAKYREIKKHELTFQDDMLS